MSSVPVKQGDCDSCGEKATFVTACIKSEICGQQVWSMPLGDMPLKPENFCVYCLKERLFETGQIGEDEGG